MLLGVLGSLAGLIIFGYTLITYLIRGSLPGFPFLASTIALFSSAQLLALGTLGEYLARVHLRLTGRPSYVKKAQAETSLAAPPAKPAPRRSKRRVKRVKSSK